MQTAAGRDVRPDKAAVVDEVRSRLTASSAALLTEYRGLKVSELAELRRALISAGGDYKIYKNTLVRLAVRDLGLELEDLLTGPTAIAFVVDGDVAEVAKALRDFARTNPALVVKGGILGDSALTADRARALADLPSREILLARLAGGMAAPLQQLAGLMAALPRNLAYGFQALIDQRGGAPEPEAAVVDPDPGADPEPAAADPEPEPGSTVESEPEPEPDPAPTDPPEEA